MVDLFQQKAISKGFIIYFDQEKGIKSDTFELWCRKLCDLNPEDFKKGMLNLEKKAEDDYRLGKEMWPPSYAEFRALSFPNSDRDSLAHKPFLPVLAIEDQTAKEKRYEEGVKQTSILLQMLDEPPRDIPTHDNSIAKKRLQQAMEKLKNEN